MKRTVALFTFAVLCITLGLYAQGSVIRDRGEAYGTLYGANTTGPGDIWLGGTLLGHVWDDAPANIQGPESERKRWVSNVRIFAEASMNAGLLDNLMLSIDSRLLGWGWKPGWVSGAFKYTPIDNKDLRLSGLALMLKMNYNVTEGPPTIGGYRGFMPEGFTVQGFVAEPWAIYELDLLSKISSVPLRVMVNVGFRFPFERASCWQTLFKAGIVFNGYDYDFFTYYTLEAFDNFSEPMAFPMGGKKHLVYFTENPSYITVGGNIRYEGGAYLTFSVPLLLSVNQQSRINRHDLSMLNQRIVEAFPDEVKRGIKDPFDPWFVKWKIVATATIPLKYKATSTEMLRNYLLLKNRKERKTIDFDQRLNSLEKQNDRELGENEEDDGQQRLEEIKKRREKVLLED